MIFDYKARDRFKKKSIKTFDDSWFTIGAKELIDRIKDINRNFERGIEVGSQKQSFVNSLSKDKYAEQKIKNFISCGWNEGLLSNREILISKNSKYWPFNKKSFDIVISNGVLQSLEDPLDYLIGSFNLLKADGLICGILVGERAFNTARLALIKAESFISKSVSPRFHPNISMVDLGRLLAKAGFVLPIIERMEFALDHKNILRLTEQIRNCGEINMLTLRRKSFSNRHLFTEWQKEIDTMSSENKKLQPLIIEAIVFIAWVPDPSQPKALRPGSAAHSFAEAVKKSKNKES